MEVAPHHGVEQHGMGSLGLCLRDETAQVGVEGAPWFRVPFGLGLFVVVPELYQHIVSRAKLFKHFSPASLVYEAL